MKRTNQGKDLKNNGLINKVESPAERGRKASRRPRDRGVSAVARAESALRLGRDVDAVKHAEAALAGEPHHLGALETLARAQWRLGLYTDLLTTLDRLIPLNPYEPGYHALRGFALQCLGRYGEAYRAFLRAGDHPGAAEAAHELASWQAGLVKEMLRDDPVFRARYVRDPASAIRAQGFHYGDSAASIGRWLKEEDARSAALTRPS